uniref:G-protein coupled receptors family 1 profile domain-containing protein n=1 Tax=Hucho hucho TaxID=62062 RepID=A0A4W5Q142_9TELE
MDSSFTSEMFYNAGSIAAPKASYLDEDIYVQEDLDVFSVAMAVLYLVVCIVGLAGNTLVIVAVLKLDKMASATTVYIFNLALADGLFMVGLPFIAIQNFQNHWAFGDLACKLVMVLDGINQFTSVFCLTVMSIDRYMALVDPLRFARWRTPRRAKIVSGFLWLFSLLSVLPMAIHFSARDGLCMVDPHVASDSWWLAFLSYTFVLGFALPSLVMTVSYTALVVTLRTHRCQANSPENGPRIYKLEIDGIIIIIIQIITITAIVINIFFCSCFHVAITLNLLSCQISFTVYKYCLWIRSTHC